MALELRRHVRCATVVQQALLRQPRQRLYHLVLRRRLVAQLMQQAVPYLLHRVLAVESTHQLVGGMVDAALACRGG